MRSKRHNINGLPHVRCVDIRFRLLLLAHVHVLVHQPAEQHARERIRSGAVRTSVFLLSISIRTLWASRQSKQRIGVPQALALFLTGAKTAVLQSDFKVEAHCSGAAQCSSWKRFVNTTLDNNLNSKKEVEVTFRVLRQSASLLTSNAYFDLFTSHDVIGFHQLHSNLEG